MRRARVRSKRKRSGGGFKFILLLLIIIGAGVFAYFSPMFERVPPKIEASKTIVANAKTPIKFKVTDNSALKSAKVILMANGKELPIYSQNFLLPSKSKEVSVALPQEILKSGIDNWDIIIEASDNSRWNFLMGNKAIKKLKLIIDNTPPQISLVAMSSYITKGGSALVIFRAIDKNLKTLYVDAGNGIKFKPIKYKKDGVYATLFAWPFYMEEYSPKIVAIDSANNISSFPLNINKLNKKYKVSKIKATDRFINGKISDLANSDPEFANIKDKIKRFKAVNELMRKKNEDYIHKLSSKVTPINGNWNIKPFKPLKGAKKVSDFGTKRYYYYGNPDNIISTSYHVGYDFASIKHDNIYSSNEGIVVSTKPNGIYGNMPLIDHGFGLYTLYGHCSSILVQEGQKVKAGDIIAKTGTTGLALGDHLHFGILIQGVEVYPLEWMKKKWINEHILDIFKKANSIIGYN